MGEMNEFELKLINGMITDPMAFAENIFLRMWKADNDWIVGSSPNLYNSGLNPAGSLCMITIYTDNSSRKVV